MRRRLLLSVLVGTLLALLTGLLPVPSQFGKGFGALGETGSSSFIDCLDSAMLGGPNLEQFKSLDFPYQVQNYGLPLSWRQVEKIGTCEKQASNISLGALVIDALILSALVYLLLNLAKRKSKR
jgi:hypothetical protein